MSNPLFSVLVPTRNRASLLREALPTVIDQTMSDYEIVVSDNNSDDDTKAVIESFMEDCPRIRYVNPGKSLSMCAHFDYIYEQARGEYVCYVSDDDGMVPTALEASRQAIEEHKVSVLMWSNAGYFHQDVPEVAQRGRMWGQLGTGALYEIPSNLSIAAYMDFEILALWNVIPKMLKSVVRRDLVEACAARSNGQFHLPPFPDHSASCQLLANHGSYHFLDLPLYVSGVSYNSNAGMRYNRKEKYAEYFSLFSEDMLENVPYPQRAINASYFYSGIQRFKHLYPDQFRGEINVDNYLRLALKELLGYQKTEDVSEEMDDLKAGMRDHSGGEDFYQRCLASLKKENLSSDLKRKLLEVALTSPFLVRLAMGGRRRLASLRGRQSLDFTGVASMREACAVAQTAADTRHERQSTFELRQVSTREQLFGLQ